MPFFRETQNQMSVAITRDWVENGLEPTAEAMEPRLLELHRVSNAHVQDPVPTRRKDYRDGNVDQMLCLEKRICLEPEYITRQKMISPRDRALIIDRITSVVRYFELRDTTLHLAIATFDRFCATTQLSGWDENGQPKFCKGDVDNPCIDLAAVVCLKLSDVFIENSKEYYKQDNAKEYCDAVAKNWGRGVASAADGGEDETMNECPFSAEDIVTLEKRVVVRFLRFIFCVYSILGS